VSADPYEMLDAAYVMGALEPEERREFEAHLLTCDACSERVEELRPTVGLLAAARAAGAFDESDESLAGPPIPETLLPGLLRRAARERSRRRIFTASVVGVAAACVIALAIVLLPSSSGSSQPAPQALQAVRPSPVHATAVLVSKPWGTEIELHCRYDTGVAAGVPYGLRVYDKDGGEQPYSAGTWTLTPGKVTDFTGGVAIARDDIAKMQITLPDGTAILQLTL
jgi:hypothetical protein